MIVDDSNDRRRESRDAETERAVFGRDDTRRAPPGRCPRGTLPPVSGVSGHWAGWLQTLLEIPVSGLRAALAVIGPEGFDGFDFQVNTPTTLRERERKESPRLLAPPERSGGGSPAPPISSPPFSFCVPLTLFRPPPTYYRRLASRRGYSRSCKRSRLREEPALTGREHDRA